MNHSFRKTLLTAIIVLTSTNNRISAQDGNQPPIDLSRKLSEFRTVKPNWAIGLMVLLDRSGIPYLFELDTLTYQDMSVRDKLGLFRAPSEEQKRRIEKWATAFKVDLKDVTIEQAIKEILKDQPRYTYEIIGGGRCLHVFAHGIQERKDWPLNQPVPEFSINQEQINQGWYRKVLGVFLMKYQVHIGEFRGQEFVQKLQPRSFRNITLRELLTELAITCRMGWIVEPFPEEEIRFRDTHNKEYYERGYDIGRPGTNGWYQIHFSFLNEPPK